MSLHTELDIDFDVSVRVQPETRVFPSGRLNDKDEGTEHRALGYALRQRSSGGGSIANTDELLSVGEVGLEPGESGAGDVEGRSVRDQV